jgi:para-nitrobenzyl esterase
VVAVSLVALALAVAGCQSSADDVEVEIDTGTLRGVADGGVRSWLGIPYAAPPDGDMRWQAPERAASWSGVRDADAFAEPCLQAQGVPEPSGSEDCLYLNVFRPDSESDDLPVMVWIHGGGLSSGSGDLRTELVSGLVDQDVVVVSFNYRLGRLGYFAHPALEAEADDDRVANFGLLDQIAALRWVQDNVEQFGGDPEDVTVFGISAGGASVNYLMSSAAARDLFDRAISGSGLGRERPPTWSEAVAKGDQLVAPLSGADADADDLRAIDGETVAALPGHVLRNEIPILDSVLPASVADTFAEGEEAEVPYLVGATDLELLDAHFRLVTIDPPTLRNQLVAGREAEAGTAYDDRAEYDRHFLNDLVFSEPARHLARLHATRAPTYLYRFSVAGDEARAQLGGAVHGADLAYVFGAGGADRSVDDADELSEQISGCWASFAAAGVPTCAGLAWPEATDDAYVDFTNDGPEVVADDPWQARLDLAEAISGSLP